MKKEWTMKNKATKKTEPIKYKEETRPAKKPVVKPAVEQPKTEVIAPPKRKAVVPAITPNGANRWQ